MYRCCSKCASLNLRGVVHRMMWCILALLVTLQCTLGRAVNPHSHPNKRHAHHESIQSQRLMGMQVTPDEVTVPRDNYVTVTCTVDAGYSPGHHPMIYFYRRFAPGLAMNIDQSVPGVVVGAPHTRALDATTRRTTRTLTFLGKRAFPVLEKGTTSFYCKARLLNGDISRRDFTVFTDK